MKKPFVVLAGPTAVGKTKMSIRLAKAIGGEIISADSMQVYRHMDIGSAKIRPEEMEGVPHHLIDVLEPSEEFHVVKFQQMAKEAMTGIYDRGHIPILTGGTGFYIQAVLYDIDFTNESGERLIGVQTKPVVYSSNISMEKLVVERLIAGPDAENEELYPVINPATKVLGVTVKDGTCYVNLDNGFLTQTYNVSAEVQIYSIVNSLVELPNVNKVQIEVNGNTNMIFREKISLPNVFDRNLDLVYETEELQS